MSVYNNDKLLMGAIVACPIVRRARVPHTIPVVLFVRQRARRAVAVTSPVKRMMSSTVTSFVGSSADDVGGATGNAVETDTFSDWR